MDIPYDIENPPSEPPAGCDPLLWQVAYALRAEHAPGLDGWCIAGSCHVHSVLWPCAARELADAGLMGSIGGGVQPVQPPRHVRRPPTPPRPLR